jgi:uncharacterized DUF497 family protein
MQEISDVCIGFQWDRGNPDKNWVNHRVSTVECEQIFFNQPLVASADKTHSHREPRFYVLGQTDNERLLYIAFLVRDRQIRVISARNMNRKEKRVYEHAKKKK